MTNVTDLPASAPDDSHLRRKVEAGREASLVLESPAFAAGFESLKNAIADAWRRCAVGDADTMELLHSQARMLDQLREHLSQAINGGKAAQYDLEQAVTRAAIEERNQRFIARGLKAVGFGKR
jgi:hypothetical protein